MKNTIKTNVIDLRNLKIEVQAHHNHYHTGLIEDCLFYTCKASNPTK